MYPIFVGSAFLYAARARELQVELSCQETAPVDVVDVPGDPHILSH